MDTRERKARHSSLLVITVTVAGLFLPGCSGDGQEATSPSSQQRSGPSAPQSQQRQSPSPVPKPGADQLLSSSDVSDEQVQTVARIAFSVRKGTQADRVKIRKEMEEKYGDPQQLDSTQKAKAMKEMQMRQMKMQKKRMKILKREAKNEGMTMQRFRKIMRSAQRDSTLKKRLRAAMKSHLKKSSPTGSTP